LSDKFDNSKGFFFIKKGPELELGLHWTWLVRGRKKVILEEEKRERDKRRRSKIGSNIFLFFFF
jgi:hypothetical protein